MAPSGTTFRNGDIVGRVSVYAEYYMPIARGDAVVMQARGISVNNPYGAVPLTDMPGLGLVVRWGGYRATTALTHVTPSAEVGLSLTNRVWFTILNARAQANYTLTQNYDFELVVIDETLYKGGTLTFSERGRVGVVTSYQNGASTPVLCRNEYIDPLAALTGSVQVPELPKPVLPTCQFSYDTLNQRVTLGPIDADQVVPFGSVRSMGSEGQRPFAIQATACNRGARMNVYFSDARNNAATKNYLTSTNSAVGVRMYYGGEADPLMFGPSPVGSSVPSQRPVSVGPVTVEGGGVNMLFTAQYVRLPNKTVNDVIPGPLQADAVLTIMYP
ncbi:fimbrial protein [Alcaligenes nematophilus]|uniref:fimbrial protein n=1 Tax=Alcaligenes nematophilus TaxID=2994643 RepID=UPI0039893455